MAPAAEAISGTEIMQRVYDQSRIHKYQQSDVEMHIYQSSKESNARKRWFKSKFLLFKDRSKSIIRIYRPTAQKGIGLLSETREKDNYSTQWIYLPAFRATRKINSDSKNDSFLGSDLTIADMAGRKPSQDQHRLQSEEKNYWVVESKPKDSADLYLRFVSHIHKKALVATEVKFYNRKNELLKVLENKRIAKYDGMYMAVETTVSNKQSGGRTELKRSDIDIKSRIGKNEVGLRGLSNPE